MIELLFIGINTAHSRVTTAWSGHTDFFFTSTLMGLPSVTGSYI